MNFFLKGDFKLQESWEQKPPQRTLNSRNKSRGTEKNSSLVNAGKNIIAQPSTDILDEELSKKILKDFAEELSPSVSIKATQKTHPKQQPLPKLPPKQKMSNSPQSQSDLITSMAGRLKAVEITCKNQREQIKQQKQTIDKLKSQNTFLKGYRDNATEQYQKMKKMQNQNGQLKKKIEQMENYLKKYGLKWVGNKPEGKLQHQQMKKDIKSNYNYRLPSEIDINTITRRVEELNSGLHSEGMGTQVYQENGVHKFRKAEPLPIGFFSNGLAIKGYKFFPYKSKESLQILGDLVDGYFPYVLKPKYPNGIFLKVVDKIGQKYTNQSQSQGITTFSSKEDQDFKPLSKEQFLSKLPKQVIKNGKVIDIRGEIQKRLNGDSQKSIKSENEQNNEHFYREDGAIVFKTQENEELRGKKLKQDQICTLKIRNQQGEVYILQLKKQKKTKEIYTWMQKVSKQPFVLMSNFPKRQYAQEEHLNLEDLGLYPNALLHIHSSQ